MKTTLKWVFAVLPLLVVLSAQALELPDFTELVEEYHPTVVNISTTKKTERRSALPPGMEVPPELENSPFGDLFRRFFGEGEQAPEQFDSNSLGSGFIISKDGYVLTNNHVVEGAETVIVRLYDRRELTAEVVGIDERSDIALLKISAADLPVVKMGTGSNLKVGEWVVAIGSPFGFDHSVTAGIVSAKGRSLPNENYTPFIQTDVAINPGNSGGPLFNLDGEVVGINSQIYSRTGGFMGLSFAIPIEVAMDVVEQLKSKGKVTRGWLGVVIQEVTRELAESFGMKRAHGALVARVLPGSPAESAGVQVGDIIVAYNDNEVDKSTELPPLVGRTQVGDSADLEIMRDGKQKVLPVTIGELPEDAEIAAVTPPGEGVTDNKLGLKVGELDKETRKALDVKNGGVMVKEVKEGPAAEAGIRSGDVIVMLDNQSVENIQQFEQIVDALKTDKSIAVLVQRQDGPIFLALKPSKDK